VPDTSLHLAVQNGNIDIVKMLLEAGHSPNEANADGLTPLHIAVQMEHTDIVTLLAGKINESNNIAPPELERKIKFDPSRFNVLTWKHLTNEEVEERQKTYAATSEANKFSDFLLRPIWVVCVFPFVIPLTLCLAGGILDYFLKPIPSYYLSSSYRQTPEYHHIANEAIKKKLADIHRIQIPPAPTPPTIQAPPHSNTSPNNSIWQAGISAFDRHGWQRLVLTIVSLIATPIAVWLVGTIAIRCAGVEWQIARKRSALFVFGLVLIVVVFGILIACGVIPLPSR
jgi:hypothetical protein